MPEKRACGGILANDIMLLLACLASKKSSECVQFYPQQINVTQAWFYYVGSCMYCVSLEMKYLVSDAKRIVLLKITWHKPYGKRNQ